MKVGCKSIELIKEYCVCEFMAYQNLADEWAIGYGHTKDVKKGDLITQDEADLFLMEDLLIIENAVNQLVIVDINQDMFDALISFTFNLGIESLSQSTLLNLLNQGQYSSAAEQFEKWVVSADGKSDSLAKCREAEHQLFRLKSEL